MKKENVLMQKYKQIERIVKVDLKLLSASIICRFIIICIIFTFYFVVAIFSFNKNKN